MAEQKKLTGVRLIGLTVLISNTLLLSFFFGIMEGFISSDTLLPLISLLAVFPFDFFYSYLHIEFIYYVWIVLIMVCAIGLIRLNKFARTIFIVLNIIHVTIFAYIVINHIDKRLFLEYFFKLYFNMVASGTYVGILTIKEVRELFKINTGEGWLALFIRKAQTKHFGHADPGGYYNLGLAYRRLERFDDAVMALQKAISINPQHADFHFYLGLTYLQQKKHTPAIASFKEAARVDPIHVQAVYHLGLAFQKEGCDNEAISALRRASHIDPENQEILRCLGRSLMQAKYYHEAVDVLSKATHFDPNDFESFRLLGLIYLVRMEQFKKAQQAFKRVIQIKPDEIDAQYQLGITCIKLNTYNDAIRSFKEVIRLDEDHKQAHYQLGFTYAMIEDFDSARREYKFLKSLDSDLATNLSLLIK